MNSAPEEPVEERRAPSHRTVGGKHGGDTEPLALQRSRIEQLKVRAWPVLAGPGKLQYLPSKVSISSVQAFLMI